MVLNPLDLLIRATGESVAVISVSSKSGLNSGANFLRKKTREWIEEEGEGTWKKKRNLSRKFDENDIGKWEVTDGAKRSEGALFSLRGLVRYTRTRGNSQIDIGFSPKIKQSRIPEPFKKLALDVQPSKTFNVTAKMQRKLVASKSALPKSRQKKARAGIDYFAPKVGSSFERPQRDIFASVEKKYIGEAIEKYNKQFKKKFNREITKRGIPFTPLK